MAKMGVLKDKVAGKTKQVVAELTGDGELSEEGKDQVREAELEEDQEPVKLNEIP